MDPQTRQVYEAGAVEWTRRRSARRRDAAQALAARTTSGPSVDLGCGPGWNAVDLAAPVVALDATKAMLDLVPSHAPGALRVQADLEALPFRRASVGGAWARNSYVHVALAAIPLALADLHRALALDAPIAVSVFAGDDEGRDSFGSDDFPGRFFSRWPPSRFADVVIGAGFRIDELDAPRGPSGEAAINVIATRARTLPDYVGPQLRLLLCGLNPSLTAADAGVGFVSPSNRFWPAALAAGLVSRDRDPWHAVRAHGIGHTDLVKRATPSAKEIKPAEYREGFARVQRLAAWLQPAAVCFVGLSGYRAAVDRQAVAGWQPRPVGGRPAYVMPNPSGLNARTPLPVLVEHLRAAAAGPA